MKTKNTAIKTVLTSIVMATLSATASNAAIVMVDSMFDNNANDLTSYTVDGSTLDLTGASKIVVTTGTETAANGAGTVFSSVTYGGVALTQATTDVGGQGRASIWYLDLDSASPVGTDFILTPSGSVTQEGLGFGAYALSGTKNGVSATGTSGATSTVSLTTPTAGEFVVLSFARNNTDFVFGAASGIGGPADGAQGSLSELYRLSNGTEFSSLSAYDTLPTAGLHSMTVYENNASGRIVAASFEAVPEPSSAVLVGLGGLALLRRRR